MGILAIGLNHKTAPLAVREKVAFTKDSLDASLQELTAEYSVSEALILSTCNRTEVYCGSIDSEPIKEWFAKQQNLSFAQAKNYLYTYHEQHAVRHIMRVASGLDSMVLGEPQILGQLKSAYDIAHGAGTLGSQLNRLFQYVFSVTKQIRTHTGIGACPVSVASAAANLAKHLFADISQCKVMLIGAGETSELTAFHLREHGVKSFIVANRTLEKAQSLVNRYEGEAIIMGDIPNYLADIDIVISSTASQLPILGKGLFERVLVQRRHKPIFMVDLAVPRDIEPEVGDLDDVYLYTIDDLKGAVEENMTNRQLAAQQVENIIDDKSQHFMSWLQSLNEVDSICQYRQKVEALVKQEIQQAKSWLDKGLTPDEMFDRLAYSLGKKIMHTPTTEMRKAAFNGNMEALSIAHRLLGIGKE